MLSENNWLQNKVFNINPFCLKMYRKKIDGYKTSMLAKHLSGL